MPIKSRVEMKGNRYCRARVPKTVPNKLGKGDKVRITVSNTEGVVILADNIAARYMVKYEGGKNVFPRAELTLVHSSRPSHTEG